ncbi:MAG: peptide-methionine (S)-S-oxide reductase MsrA [Chitinophagales bacterium]|nr:peptide-methionine (S)-S-oxide reductase MsrA [Chitinophagales bacterium]
MKILTTLCCMLFLIQCNRCNENNSKKTRIQTTMNTTANSSSSAMDTATLAGGCYWCLEAIFQRLQGVEKVTSGFCGGQVKNPSYKAVCTGTTGHAEVIQLTYDSSVISFAEILKVFFTMHDPTTLNRQGNDVGTQYRSAIFYHNTTQKKEAEEIIHALNMASVYSTPIVTTVEPFDVFYIAEDYHQNYYNDNSNEGYCRYVIQPKLEKFEKVFSDKLKK